MVTILQQEEIPHPVWFLSAPYIVLYIATINSMPKQSSLQILLTSCLIKIRDMLVPASCFGGLNSRFLLVPESGF